ncbi:MAG: Perchlorate reductase subunit gamma precursor, partial [Planctomycetota bacterium]
MTARPALRLPILLFGLATVLCSLPQCGDAQAAADPTAMRASAAQDPQPTGVADEDKLQVLVSANMLGRLEPCGCASGQLGGLARRMQYIGERRNHDLLLEGGNLIDGTSPLDVEKFATAITVLAGMQHPYDALGVGAAELALPSEEWSAIAAGVPYLASDLTSTSADWPAKPFVEKSVRGRNVRVGALTMALPKPPGAAKAADAAPPGDTEVQVPPPIRLLTPADGYRRALEGAGNDDWRILIVHATDAVARELVPTLQPPPHLVICTDGSYVEPAVKAEYVANVPIVYPGIRGRILQDITLYRLPAGPKAQIEPVALQGSLTVPGGGGDPDVKQVILAHRQQVKDAGLLQAMARQTPTPNGASYVGSQNCQGCHPTAYKAFADSKHFVAFETLQKAEVDPKRYGWPVTHYPDCVSCHVVGYGEQTGYLDYEETPHLAGVGCERCHGPASEHVASGGQKKLGLHAGVQPSLLCAQCHDFEQSPDFVYGDRWPKIQ